ncbi:MAG: ribonuclease P protein component [Bacteroidales bacterium]
MDTGSEKFKKSERLCSKKIIASLIDEGDAFFMPLFKVVWLKNPASLPSPAQVAFSVPKKGFRNAVTRNLLKRRMRESYRKNKYLLYEQLEHSGICIAFIISFRHNSIASYSEIEKAMIEVLERLVSVAAKSRK